MTEREQFARQIDNYLHTRRNKRYGRDAMEYEVSWVSNVVRSWRERCNRTLRIQHNYAFLTFYPRWREIFATEFEGRRIDHELCDVLAPYCDRILSPRTYNNRKGYGSMRAINQVIEDITEASRGYTEKAWVIKIDMSGFFPNARWDVAQRAINGVIDRHADEINEEYGEHMADYLHWLVLISINANPQAHFERRTPAYLWKEHIPDHKSIITKPAGIGAAIGRLAWQSAMGLYINDEIRWLNEECMVRAVCFVDDIVITVPDRRKYYALSLLPALRNKLTAKGVRLNERKFYCQPVSHGVEFLGSHIKPYRIHLNRNTVKRCAKYVKGINGIPCKARHAETIVCTLNSYIGLLKNRTSHRQTHRLIQAMVHEWWRYMIWNPRRQCLQLLPEHSHNARLNNKYHLKLKRNDTARNSNAHQRAMEHRPRQGGKTPQL